MNTFIAIPYNNEVNVVLPLLHNSSELLHPLNYYGQILNQESNIESQAYSQNEESELASTLFKKQMDYCSCVLNAQKVSCYTREGNGISIPNSPIFNQDYMTNNCFPVSYANYQQKYSPIGFNQGVYNSLAKDEDEDSQSEDKRYMYNIKQVSNQLTGRRNKLFACSFPECGREFYKKWNCTEHYKTHTKEKPFECIACGMLFAQKGSLFKHIKAKSRKGINHGYTHFMTQEHGRKRKH